MDKTMPLDCRKRYVEKAEIKSCTKNTKDNYYKGSPFGRAPDGSRVRGLNSVKNPSPSRLACHLSQSERLYKMFAFVQNAEANILIRLYRQTEAWIKPCLLVYFYA